MEPEKRPFLPEWMARGEKAPEREPRRESIEMTPGLEERGYEAELYLGEDFEDAAYRFYREHKAYSQRKARLATDMLMRKFEMETEIYVERLTAPTKVRDLNGPSKRRMVFSRDGWVSIQDSLRPGGGSIVDNFHVVRFPEELEAKRTQISARREIHKNTGIDRRTELSGEVVRFSRFKDLSNDPDLLKKELGVPSNYKVQASAFPSNPDEQGFYSLRLIITNEKGYLDGTYFLEMNPVTGEVQVRSAEKNNEVVREGKFSDRDTAIEGLKPLYSIDMPNVGQETQFVIGQRKLFEMLQYMLKGKTVKSVRDVSNPFFDLAAYQVDLGGKVLYFAAQSKAKVNGHEGMAFRVANGGMTGETLLDWSAKEGDVADVIDRFVA